MSPTVRTLAALLQHCNVTLEEFFFSAAPKEISQAHVDLHAKLQAILESGGDDEVGIRLNIEAIFEHLKSRKKRITKKQRMRSAKSSALGGRARDAPSHQSKG